MYIPDVTLGRPARTGSWARTCDYGAERQRGRRNRTKLTLAGGGLFLVVLAAGLLTFMSGVRQLGDSSHPSTTAGLTPPTAYEGRKEQPVIQEEPAWWKPTAPPDPLASGVPAPRSTDRVESYEQNSPAGLASVDVGRGSERTITEPIINPDRRREQEGGGGTPTSNALGTSAQPDTTSHAVPTAPDLRKEPQVAAPPTPPTAEPRSRPPASAQAKAEPQQPQQGQVKAPVPQVKPSTAPAKTTAARSREIENLLAEGDARLAEGDLDAARSAYEQAYDKGSRAAASRMAQTFDPRNVGESAKTASPAEAILWYQDAARKGDRGARQELDNLATWLENDAASGNQEARRVLELWRQPPEPEADAY